MRAHKTHAAALLLLAINLATTAAGIPGFISRAVNSIPAQWRNSPVIVAFDTLRAEFTCDPRDGNQLSTVQVTWYYINHASPAELKRIHVFDEENVEAAPQLAVTAFTTSGSVLRYSGVEVSRSRLTDAFSFSDNKYVHETGMHVSTVSIADYGEGMAIRLEVHRLHVRPEFIARFDLRDDYPTLNRYMVAQWPSASGAQVRLLNPENVDADTARSTTNGRDQLEVHARMLAQLPEEPTCRAPESWYAALHLVLPLRAPQPPTWTALGDHWLAMIARSTTPSPKIEQIASTLRGRAPDSILAAAFLYVNDAVRYYGDWRGVHGYVPRPSSTVLEHGYGDCKEMALVLSQVITGAGLPSHMALVSTPGEPQPLPALPTLGSFNHAIVRVEMPDGSERYLDPTNVYATHATSVNRLDDRRVLLVLPGSSRLDSITPHAGTRNGVHIHSTVTVSADSTARLKGFVALTGRSAADFAERVSATTGIGFGAMVSRILGAWLGVPTESAVVRSLSTDSVALEFDMPAGSYLVRQPHPSMVLGAPAVPALTSDFAMPSGDGPRYLEALDYQASWAVPADWRTLSATTLASRLGSGRWEMQSDIVTCTYHQPRTVIGVEDLDEFRAFATALNRFSTATISR